MSTRRRVADSGGQKARPLNIHRPVPVQSSADRRLQLAAQLRQQIDFTTKLQRSLREAGSIVEVRVYICSTTADMIAEREALHKTVFPRLNEWASRFRLRFLPVDLRTPLPGDDSTITSRGPFLLAAHEIARCRPWVVALIGNKYGHAATQPIVPAKWNVEGEFDWAAQLEPTASAFEAECHYAFLGADDPRLRCLAMLRDGRYASDIADVGHRSVFSSDETDDIIRTSQFREKVKSHKRVRAEGYSVSWKVPKGGFKGPPEVSGLDEFSDKCLAALRGMAEDEFVGTAAADAAQGLGPDGYPPGLPPGDRAYIELMEAVAVERLYQDSAVESRARGFAGREEVLRDVVAFIAARPGAALRGGKELRRSATSRESLSPTREKSPPRGDSRSPPRARPAEAGQSPPSRGRRDPLEDDIFAQMSEYLRAKKEGLNPSARAIMAPAAATPRLGSFRRAASMREPPGRPVPPAADEAAEAVPDYEVETHESVYCVTGEAGVGKSALLAKVIVDRLCGWSRRHVFFFAGATPGPCPLAALLRHLLVDLLELLPPDEAQAPLARVTDTAGLVRAFHETLAVASKRRAIVIVLDALEALDGEGQALAWLPSRLPAGVKFLVSSLEGSAPLAALRRRFGVRPVRLPRLAEAVARPLADALLDGRAVPLVEEDFNGLLARGDCGLPRYLELAAAALAQYGGADSAECGAVCGELPATAEELVAWLVARLEGEFGPELVQVALGGLACARAGLTESEFAILLARPSEPALPRRVLAELVRGLAPLLRPVYEGGTVLELACKQIRRVVARSLLSPCPQDCPVAASGSACKHQSAAAGIPTWAAKDAPFHRRLAGTFLRLTPRDQISALKGRVASELRYHLREGPAYDMLAEQTAAGSVLTLNRALSVFADSQTLATMIGALAARDALAGVVFAGATAHVPELPGRALGKYVQASKMLRSLAIRRTAFAEPAQEAVFAALGTNKSVAALELDTFLFERKGSAALAASLRANAALKTLTLANCRLPDEAAGHLAEGLGSNPGLTSVSLAGCALSDAGGAALLASLASNKVMKRLELRGVRLGPAAVRALGESVRANKQLAELDIEQCGLDGRDAALAAALDAFADGLGSNEILASLSLARNALGSRGLQALVRALRRNRALESVHLAHNGIDNEGALELAACLTDQAKSTALQTIDLSHNAIGKAGESALLVAKGNAKSLQTLALEGNVPADGPPPPKTAPQAASVAHASTAHGSGAASPTNTSKRSVAAPPPDS